jgi:molecular chaperone DnaJ
MATTRDYYEILGVPRDADERAIKSAFRKLARELHPDVSDHPEAQERFREAAAAYEVLSKSETRELYDRYGHEGLRTGGFSPTDFDLGSLGDLFGALFGDDLFGGLGGRPGRRSARGADILAEVEIELAEAATGVRRAVLFPAVVECATCHGTGAAPGTSPTTCARCGGTGRLQSVSNSFFGQVVRTQSCPECGGAGDVVESPCEDCSGTGRLTEQRELEVEIPPGIHDGQRIRLSGEGHAGLLGGRSGDVYVLVTVRSDPRFVREGNDIVSAVDLTMTQAALGGTVPVETLDGTQELQFDPGTQPGEIRALRGKGMPVLQGRGRGDHRVLVNVAIPAHLTEEQRRLLDEFARSEHDRNYGSEGGLFERLRSAFR